MPAALILSRKARPSNWEPLCFSPSRNTSTSQSKTHSPGCSQTPNVSKQGKNNNKAPETPLKKTHRHQPVRTSEEKFLPSLMWQSVQPRSMVKATPTAVPLQAWRQQEHHASHPPTRLPNVPFLHSTHLRIQTPLVKEGNLYLNFQETSS